MNKIQIHLQAKDGGPFNCAPARSVDLDPEAILLNDVVFPWENHPHGMGAFVIGHEFGAVALAWGNCLQDALDEACDAGLMESFLIDSPDSDDEESGTHLGNEGTLHNLDNSWVQEVDLAKCEAKTLCAMAEGRGACADTLDEIL